MNFLQLCKEVVKDSGTVSNFAAFASVENQTGRLARFVGWTADALYELETERKDWRWMRLEFSGKTIIATQKYDATAMSISEPFSHWLAYEYDCEHQITCQPATGTRADERPLTVYSWDVFRHNFMFGLSAEATGRPQAVAIDPQNKLVFHPTPDAEYIIRGEYQRAPVTMTLNDDVPAMPEKYHMIVKWMALLNMGIFDEAADQLPAWEAKRNEIHQQLVQEQLPAMSAPPSFT